MTVQLREGIAAFERNDFQSALAVFRKAVEAAPQEPVARMWYGQVLCRLGKRFDGLQHLQQATSGMLAGSPESRDDNQAPVHPMIFQALAQLQQWGDYEQAVTIARQLAARSPDDARAQHLLAVICGQLNLTTEALTAAEKASMLQPDSPSLEVFRASLEVDAKQYQDALDRLDRLLEHLTVSVERPGPDYKEQLRALCQGLKELARVLDALGEFDAVFPQLEAAASIAPSLPEYKQQDLDLLPQTLATNAEGFMPRQSHARPDPVSRAPVFVLGFFRSGTTLIQQVLRNHSDVFLSDEVGLLRSALREVHSLRPGSESVVAKLARLDSEALNRVRAAYWRAARDYHGPDCANSVFVDKFALNTVDLALIDAIFPDAHVLFAVRDPRDVCVSCVMQLMTPGPATMHLLRLEDAASLYAQVMQFWLRIRGQLLVRWRQLRYEDVVADPEASFRQTFAFIGLEWQPRVLAFHQHATGRYVASPSRHQVAQPLYRSSLARWRHYEDELRTALPLLAPFIDEFGYDRA